MSIMSDTTLGTILIVVAVFPWFTIGIGIYALVRLGRRFAAALENVMPTLVRTALSEPIRDEASPAAELEKHVRSLPIVESHEVARTCMTCAHFDHEAGQAHLNCSPAFTEVMDLAPPWMVGGEAAPTKVAWGDFGLCDRTGTIQPHSESCEEHQLLSHLEELARSGAPEPRRPRAPLPREKSNVVRLWNSLPQEDDDDD